MRFLFHIPLCLFFFIIPADANVSKDKLVQKVEQYFHQLKTYQADFMQVNPDNLVVRGKFYLQRPNKFRLDYLIPKKLVLLSDGTSFIEYDPKDNTTNLLSLDSTPAAILMKENIKLSGEITVKQIQAMDNIIQVSLYRTDDPSLGSITLVFKENPMQLIHWYIYDAQGGMTEVALKNIRENQKLPSDLFRIPQ